MVFSQTSFLISPCSRNKSKYSFLFIFLIFQTVKNLSAMWESLGREDPLKKGMATHSSVLAWRIPWTEEPGGLQSMGSQRVEHSWVTNASTFTFSRVKNASPDLYFILMLILSLPSFPSWTQTLRKLASVVACGGKVNQGEWFLSR